LSLVSVIKNSPRQAYEVFRSIHHYSLNITRAGILLLAGRRPISPCIYASLFLSGNSDCPGKQILRIIPAGVDACSAKVIR